MIHPLPPITAATPIPESFPDPFSNQPHPIAVLASENLQSYLVQHPLLAEELWSDEGGKMFGVLVVRQSDGRLGYLAAFTGMLNRQWRVEGFVPPVFDVEQRYSFLHEGESKRKHVTDRIQGLLNDKNYHRLQQELLNLQQQSEKDLKALKERHRLNKAKRKQDRLNLSQQAGSQHLLAELSWQSRQDKRAYKTFKKEWRVKIDQLNERIEIEFRQCLKKLRDQQKKLSRLQRQQVLDGYPLKNGLGESRLLRRLFGDKEPTAGAGDCVAPKLIQYANRHALQPVALAEFWWGGAAPQAVRHHAHYYAPCRGKCQPILPFMLQGINKEATNAMAFDNGLKPDIVYEDESLVIINKPAGLLSVPGRKINHSVQSWLHRRYENEDEVTPLLLHRLDMATSGLLVAAKTGVAQRFLQKQFMQRKVKKRYVAVLSRSLQKKSYRVSLPLRVDLDDRPRQLVCYQFGKPALTEVKVVSSNKGQSRVHLYPITGRTHQLRVHMAHQQGLHAPIVGDELYGIAAERLLLHAGLLQFTHPVTLKPVRFESTAPF